MRSYFVQINHVIKSPETRFFYHQVHFKSRLIMFRTIWVFQTVRVFFSLLKIFQQIYINSISYLAFVLSKSMQYESQTVWVYQYDPTIRIWVYTIRSGPYAYGLDTHMVRNNNAHFQTNLWYQYVERHFQIYWYRMVDHLDTYRILQMGLVWLCMLILFTQKVLAVKITNKRS